MNEDRDTKLFASLIYLADTLVAGYDVIDVADAMVATCGELLPIDAAGIMVDDQRGGVRVLAATNEEMRLLELLELQANAGPCVEAMASGSTVEVPDLKEAADRWPDFVPQALSEGFHSAYAVPMKLRDRMIGSLNMFKSDPEPLSSTDLQIAHVVTSMAAIGMVNHQAIRRQGILTEQLQAALNTAA